MLFCFVVLLFCASVKAFLTAQEVATIENASIVPLRQNSLSRYTFPELRCDTDLFPRVRCVNDQLLTCSPDGAAYFQPCLFYGRMGYCNCEGTGCVPDPPYNCYNWKKECHERGAKLPVPDNCKQFTYCDSQLFETTYQCSDGYVYDPTSEHCVLGGICPTIRCPVNGISYVPFPQSPQYYIFCVNGQIQRISKCAQEGYVAATTGCQYRCVNTGYFPDPNIENCMKGIYYECRRNEIGAIEQTKHRCEDGTRFDPYAQYCTWWATCNGYRY